MKKRFYMLFLFVFTFIILVDLYSFKGLKLVLSNLDSKFIKYTIYIIYWIIPLIVIISLLYLRSIQPFDKEPRIFKNFFYLAGFFILFYIPKLIFILFHLTEDIIQIIKWISSKISSTPDALSTNDNLEISRSRFITQLGLIIAAIPFTGILYGITKGRFNFRIENHKIPFTKLPKSFSGFKLIHISDIHIGSFFGHENQVQKGIEIINSQNPDVIVFTGDLVNNFYEELNGWIPILKQLKAKYGKFSILGNHDYGDYFEWENRDEKEQNLNNVKNAHNEMGFRLLLNENERIVINGESITISGVENWGLPPFPQYGNIAKALANTDSEFKILLSHDPSHWDAEIIEKTDVDLTLSGHTHGMQFGIEIGNIKWSPVKYKYPRWAGLYQQNSKYLYVNRGFGYIGFPGRIGMPPEITVLELIKA